MEVIPAVYRARNYSDNVDHIENAGTAVCSPADTRITSNERSLFSRLDRHQESPLAVG